MADPDSGGSRRPWRGLRRASEGNLTGERRGEQRAAARPRTAFGLTPLVLMLAGLTSAPAHALDCPAMPQQSRQDWDVEIKAAVGRIGLVGGAELASRTRRTTTDLLGRLPGADKLYLEQMLFASYCSALRDSPGLTEEQRGARVQAYGREVRRALQMQAATGTGRADERNDPAAQARRELSRQSVEYSPRAFVASAEQGSVAQVESFLKAGISPDSVDGRGYTPLMLAAAAGHLPVVKALLRAGADTHRQGGPWGLTALALAAERGRVDVLRLLLAQKPLPAERDQAFVAAAAAAQPASLQLLLPGVSDRRAVASQALIATVWSIAWFSAEADGGDERLTPIVRQLLDWGADVGAVEDDAGGLRMTPLTAAAARGRLRLATMLLDAGARIDQTCPCGGYLDAGLGQMTPLAIAARTEGEATARVMALLLDRGADVKARAADGRSVLMLALAGRHHGLVGRLLSLGADPNVPDLNGDVPLMPAAQADDADLIGALLAHGARADAVGQQGNTPLIWAAAANADTAIAALLQAGADINRPNRSQRTPLMIAVRNQALDAARVLLARGADVHRQDEDGLTALGYAQALNASETRTRLLSMLKRAGAS